MRPVSIAGFAQLDHTIVDARLEEPEMVREVTAAALDDAGLARSDVGFVCSGSSDYSIGRPFSFATALDGVGAFPPIRESHVESDGAWAMYESWVRLQHGDVDVALIYCYGKSSVGDMDRVLGMQLDPYTEAPLGASPMTLAALQARAMLDSGRFTERQFAEVVARANAASQSNPRVPSRSGAVDALLAAPTVSAPLRAHDGPVRTDGAAALVLKVGGDGPRITGLDHRIDSMSLGLRDLTQARSARIAAEAMGGVGGAEVAELHGSYSPQVLLLIEADV